MSLVSRIESDKSEDLLPIGALHAAFQAQRKAYLRAPFPSYDDRIKHMKAVAAMVLSHRKEMAGALHEDFGNHPAAPGQLIEVLGIVSRVEYNSRHLADWMKVETRELDPQIWEMRRLRCARSPRESSGIWSPGIFLSTSLLAPSLTCSPPAIALSSSLQI